MSNPALRRRGAGALCCGLLGACGSWSEPGVQVELVTRGSLAPGQELRSGLGIVRIEELWWTSSEIEIERCDPALGFARRWLVREAHAHGTSSPTRVAVPFVVSATLRELVALGQLAPPAGRYCSVRYSIGPADADAVGLPEAPEMLERSFLLRGAFGARADQLEAFELQSGRAFDVTRSIELELTAEQPRASLELSLDPALWLGGIDLGSITGAAREEAVMALFRAALQVRMQ